MERNKQEKKLKELRKLAESNYWKKDYDWVEVEEPQFMGWESTLYLSDWILRTPEAPALIEVMKVMGGDEGVFFKDQKLLAIIRKSSKNLQKVNEAYLREINKKLNKENWFTHDTHSINQLTKTLNRKQYDSLSQKAKAYFYEDSRNAWGSTYKYYKLSRYTFPMHHIFIKVDKAYSKYKGIPKSEEWSESDKVRDIINNSHYWCSKNGFSGYIRGTEKAKRTNQIQRKTWNQATKAMVTHYDPYEFFIDVEDDEYIEMGVIESIETKLSHKARLPWG